MWQFQSLARELFHKLQVHLEKFEFECTDVVHETDFSQMTWVQNLLAPEHSLEGKQLHIVCDKRGAIIYLGNEGSNVEVLNRDGTLSDFYYFQKSYWHFSEYSFDEIVAGIVESILTCGIGHLGIKGGTHTKCHTCPSQLVCLAKNTY